MLNAMELEILSLEAIDSLKPIAPNYSITPNVILHFPKKNNVDN